MNVTRYPYYSLVVLKEKCAGLYSPILATPSSSWNP